MSDINMLRATIKGVLEHARVYKWTIQGLGMLRTRFDDRYRLHVWSNEHRVKDVTAIHDHPWNLISHVVSGEIEDITYRIEPEGDPAWEYMEQEIGCGPGGKMLGEPRSVYLYEHDRATFLAGQDYAHNMFEVHESRPSDGAVSLIETWNDTGLAHVYYKPGAGWVSAEPRPATEAEVRAIVEKALILW